MPKFARAHHFVPKFFLSNFTQSGTPDDYLHVVDLKTRKRWNTKPENVGHRRDLYRVDVAGMPPDSIEQHYLAPIENIAAHVIREVLRSQSIPTTGDAREFLFFFLAILATRVPITRFMIDSLVDKINRNFLKKKLADPAEWDAMLAEMTAMGLDTEGLGRDEFSEGLPKIRFRATQHFQIAMMIEGAETIFPELMSRTWSIGLSSSGSFICADRPIALAFSGQPSKPGFPAFGRSDTVVIIPLSRHVIIEGHCGGVSSLGSLNRVGVARINSLTLNTAERFIFAPSMTFPWMASDRKILEGEEQLPAKGDPVFIMRDDLMGDLI